MTGKELSQGELILERLERLEEKITPLSESAQAVSELREELAPRVNEAVHALIVGMADVEADFQIEDLTYLVKKAMRNVKNLNFTLDQLKNVIDFAVTAEPLLKSSVPQMIMALDELEQQGVFRMMGVMVDVLKKIATTYSTGEIQEIGDGLVRLMGIARKLTTPEALDLLERAADIPASVDVTRARPVGAFGLLGAMGDPDVKQGMGVLMELTKGLALMKAEN